MKLLKHTILTAVLLGASCALSNAAVLFTSAGQLVNEQAVTLSTGISRDANAAGALYFKYTVTNPGSYTTGGGSSNNFFAGMSLYNGGAEGPGFGKASGFGGYSSFATVGTYDFKSANGQSGAGTWQPISSSDTTTIVIKIDFVAGANDNVTVWLNPNLTLTEAAQSASLTTYLSGDCTFNNVQLREFGQGSGWNFSNIAIADSSTSTGFFVPEPSAALLGGLGMLALLRRRR